MSNTSEELDAPYAVMLDESEWRMLCHVLASVDLKTGEQRPINWGSGKNKKQLLNTYANIFSKAVMPSRAKQR